MSPADRLHLAHDLHTTAGLLWSKEPDAVAARRTELLERLHGVTGRLERLDLLADRVDGDAVVSELDGIARELDVLASHWPDVDGPRARAA